LPPSYLAPEDWAGSETYLFGVDLFNEGFFWEAHELWEALWLGAKGRDDDDSAEFLQGLIQCAAARLKVAQERPRGLQRLTASGCGFLRAVAERRGEHYMGLHIPSFVAAMSRYASAPGKEIEPWLVLASGRVSSEDV